MTASRYVDPIAVEKAVAGYPVRLTISERRAAIQQLTRYGLSASTIAERVHVSSRTVVRARSTPEVRLSRFGD